MSTRAGARVHVTGPVPGRVQARLAELFTLAPEPGGADGILALLTTRIDGSYLDAAGPQVRVVANYAAGVDNIDLVAARQRGVVVANTPGVLTQATAELAVTLMLCLLRRVVEGDRLIRRGESWAFGLDFMLGESLAGKTVGIVGAGRIGLETARLVEAFGAQVVLVGRGELLGRIGQLDILSLHCPGTPETHHLVDAEMLAAMRPTAVLINTSRGSVVDERALAAALAAGTIAGAALDVYEREPDVEPALLQLENVVLAPHLGSATGPTREAMGMLAVDALEAVLLHESVPSNTVV